MTSLGGFDQCRIKMMWQCVVTSLCLVCYLQSSAGGREEETRGHRERERADGERETGSDDETLPV